MSAVDIILSICLGIQTGWIYWLEMQTAKVTRSQQRNLDELNAAMRDHTHMFQVGGPTPTPTPTHAPYYQDRP